MISPPSQPKKPMLLHWMIAFAVGGMLLIGYGSFSGTVDDFPEKALLLAVHMAGGMIVLALTIIQIVGIIRNKSIDPSNSSSRRISTTLSIPLLLIALTASGLTTSVLSGLNVAVFGGASSQAVMDWSNSTSYRVHSLLAIGLCIAVGVHIGRKYRE